MINNLTKEQAGALVRFIERNGFQWKAQLYKLWQGVKTKHKVPPADTSLLRQLRNFYGPMVERTYTAEINQLKRLAGVAENA